MTYSFSLNWQILFKPNEVMSDWTACLCDGFPCTATLGGSTVTLPSRYKCLRKTYVRQSITKPQDRTTSHHRLLNATQKTAEGQCVLFRLA